MPIAAQTLILTCMDLLKNLLFCAAPAAVGRSNNMNDTSIPISEKYTLTIKEAAHYFGLGENKLRRLAAERPTASWVILNGNRILIKRRQFEKTLDSLDVI